MIALVASVLMGIVVGIPALRVQSHYLGIVTLGLVLTGCAVTSDAPADPVRWTAVSAPAGPVADGPVHVRVGLDAARTDAGRARAAVEALVRSGGLTRSTVLVAVPTGSGWVDEGAVRSLEQLTGGDLATVTVRYAQHPSWVEYVLGTSRAESSATALLVGLLGSPELLRLLNKLRKGLQ